MDNTNKLRIVYGDYTLGVHGDTFHYIFSYSHGGLESLVIDNKEWLYRVPKPTFWRATTDNDCGNGFSYQSAMWLGADMFVKCSNIEITIDGKGIKKPIAPENNKYSSNEFADTVGIKYTYQTSTTPSTTVDIDYNVDNTGKITVRVQYHGQKGLPSLPLFGMRFIMPTAAVGYEYDGLSGETYPDRMAGGVQGTYYVEGLPVTPYLVPQDCNVHMNTKRLLVERNTTLNNADKSSNLFKLQFDSIEKEFAFSCIPYTAEEMENATHQEELPLARRTVVSILGAVRGVGGINSWGADVEDSYRINAEQDIEFSFSISGVQS